MRWYHILGFLAMPLVPIVIWPTIKANFLVLRCRLALKGMKYCARKGLQITCEEQVREYPDPGYEDRMESLMRQYKRWQERLSRWELDYRRYVRRLGYDE